MIDGMRTDIYVWHCTRMKLAETHCALYYWLKLLLYIKYQQDSPPLRGHLAPVAAASPQNHKPCSNFCLKCESWEVKRKKKR